MCALKNENICQGKWTRVNTNSHQEKSIIDSMVCSKPFLHHKQEMIIDEEWNPKLSGKNRTNDKKTIKIKGL